MFCKTVFLRFCFQVKLGERGWKERYYAEKFEAQTPEDMRKISRDVVSFSKYQHIVLNSEVCSYAVVLGIH